MTPGYRLVKELVDIVSLLANYEGTPHGSGGLVKSRMLSPVDSSACKTGSFFVTFHFDMMEGKRKFLRYSRKCGMRAGSLRQIAGRKIRVKLLHIKLGQNE